MVDHAERARRWMAELCSGDPNDTDGGASPRIEGACGPCAESLTAEFQTVADAARKEGADAERARLDDQRWCAQCGDELTGYPAAVLAVADAREAAVVGEIVAYFRNTPGSFWYRMAERVERGEWRKRR